MLGWGCLGCTGLLDCGSQAAACHAAPPLLAVFPPTPDPDGFPGFSTLPSQGLEGSDFECPGSVLQGACAFRLTFDAVSICVWLAACRAVTVYANGRPGPACTERRKCRPGTAGL